MRSIAATIIIPAATVALSACAVPPPAGPTVMALPGQGKDFAAFQQDDMACRQYAFVQSGGTAPGVAASQSAVGTAAGPGAAIGAATGLIAGTAIGANNANATYGSVQQAYDISYSQCMVAHGDSIQAPPVNYAGGYPYPYAYPYPPYPYGYPSGFYAPSIAFG